MAEDRISVKGGPITVKSATPITAIEAFFYARGGQWTVQGVAKATGVGSTTQVYRARSGRTSRAYAKELERVTGISAGVIVIGTKRPDWTFMLVEDDRVQLVETEQ
ncbi:MAG: hypothetical protein CMH57_02525 [Myxococcales bacterium]|nr:hypothetical protein [Myxococcales bacterium]